MANAIRLPAARSAAIASTEPSTASSPDPDAAVEVEDHLVVASARGATAWPPRQDRRWLPCLLVLPPARSCCSRCARSLLAALRRRRRRGERAGRGGRAQPAASRPARRRLQGGRGARSPGKDGGERKPSANLDPDKTYEVTMDTSCGSFTIRLDQKTAPNTAASFASLAKKRVLRRHGLPPDRARVRDPGWRPDRHRQRRARATPSSTSRRRTPKYTRGVVAMAKTGARAARHGGQPVLRGHRRRTPACRPSTRCSARS